MSWLITECIHTEVSDADLPAVSKRQLPPASPAAIHVVRQLSLYASIASAIYMFRPLLTLRKPDHHSVVPPGPGPLCKRRTTCSRLLQQRVAKPRRMPCMLCDIRRHVPLIPCRSRSRISSHVLAQLWRVTAILIGAYCNAFKHGN